MSKPIPRDAVALAEMLDRESFVLKSYGWERSNIVAAQLRRIADVLEGKG